MGGTGSTIELQGVQRATSGMHEELRRTDLQVRVQNVHEILRQEIVKR
jgi:hypothetical protein